MRNELKRIIVDVLLLVVIGILLFYIKPDNPAIQLFLYKILLASGGFLQAHIIRKMAFPKVDWTSMDMPYLKILVITLYAGFIYTFAAGG